MAFDGHANFAISTVATAPSPATTGTSLILAAGTGTLMPVAPFNATVWANGQTPTSSNSEIVRVTSRSGDSLTIVRTQESSSARTVITGDQFMAGITKKTLTDIESAVGTGSGTGLPAGWFDVTAYGAVADGTTDSTTAFQSAINAASVGASSGYFYGAGVVYVPPAANNYVVSNLTYNVSGLKFKGGGLNSSVVAQKSGATGAMLKPATINSTVAFLYLSFEDMFWTGANNTGGTNTVGVDLTSTRICHFERVGFSWFNLAGILIQCGPNGGNGVNDSIGHAIHDCVFENSVAPSPGILIRTNPSDLNAFGQGYTNIENNWFNGNGNDNVAIAGQMTQTRIAGNHFMSVVVPFSGSMESCHYEGNTHENFGNIKTSAGFSGVFIDMSNTGPGDGTTTGFQSLSTLWAFNAYAVPNVTNRGVTFNKAGWGHFQRVFDGPGYGLFSFVTSLYYFFTDEGTGVNEVPPF